MLLSQDHGHDTRTTTSKPCRKHNTTFDSPNLRGTAHMEDSMSMNAMSCSASLGNRLPRSELSCQFLLQGCTFHLEACPAISDKASPRLSSEI